MRLDKDSVDYFKSLAEELGIPYQTLINCISGTVLRKKEN
jgi:predicted DNA binding CopG/RHH family protein